MPEQAARGRRRTSSSKGNLIALRELALRHDRRARRRPDGTSYRARARRRADLAGGRAHPRLRQPEPARARLVRARRGAWRPGCARRGSPSYVETPGPAPSCPRRTATRARRRPCASPSSSAPRPRTLTGHDVAGRGPRLRAQPQRHHDRRSASRRARAGGSCCSARSSTSWCGSSGDIDVYVITRRRARDRSPPCGRRPRAGPLDWRGYVCAARQSWRCCDGGRRGRCSPASRLPTSSMLYLLGGRAGGVRASGRGPVDPRVASLSVAAFDFFFVPPYLHLRGLRHASTWSRSP